MKILNKKAVSIIEYAVLFIIIIGAFLIMKHYIQRGINGNWGKTGQSFAFGRQYDPQKTIECSFDDQSNQWYDRNCFEYYKNVGSCADGSTCGAVSSGYCADHSRCGCSGDATCEKSIINNKCSAGDNSSCNNLNNSISQ